MKKQVLFLFLLFSASFGFLPGQFGNLVPNNDFEISTAMPDQDGELYKAAGWGNLNGGTVYPAATPDYFHVNGTGNCQLPNSFAGTINPLSGNAVVGFITYNVFVSNFREYIAIPLNAPMVPGNSYNVSFWLSNSTANHYGAFGTNNIGVAFTNGAPNQLQHEVVAITPQIEIPYIVHHANWVQYSFTISASSNFDYMVIGNFKDDNSTARASFTSGYGLSYYFLDLFSVELANPLPIEGVTLGRDNSAEGIALEWRFPAENAEGKWTLERSLDQNTYTSVTQYDNQTGVMSDLDVTFNDEGANPNLRYYYRLRHVNLNGETQLSNTVQASFKGEGSFTAGVLYPNPVQDHFSIEFSTAEEGRVQMDVIDALGKVVFNQDTDVAYGEHILSYELDQDLSEGVYYARLSFRGEQITRRLVVAGN